MEIKVQMKVGETAYQINIDEKSEMESLHKAAVLGNPPKYCHECQNNEFFKLDSNKDKEGNIYVNIRCTACGSSAKLGQYKSGGYFWHKFEKYIKKSDGSKPNVSPQPNNNSTEAWDD